MKKLAVLAALSTSILGFSAGASSADYTLHILHINDWHSRVESINKYDSTCSQEERSKNECFGGAARLVTAIRQQRERLDNQNVLVLNAGDNYQGSLFFQTYKGEAETEFSNLMDFDAMTVGNHEFDNGEDGLMIFLNKAEFPVLGANITPNAQSRVGDKLAPNTVVEIGGERIGIIGVVTADTAEVASPGPNLSFEDDVAALEEQVKALTDQGVNKIIALTHVGYVRDRDVLAKVPGVDVVVGGHSHTTLSNTDAKADGPYPTMVDNPEGYQVPVVSAGSYSKYLGNLTVTFDDNGKVTQAEGDPVLLDSSIAEDEQVVARVAELAGPIEELKAKQVGEFTAAVDGGRETCRSQECTMGNLIADAMLDRTKEQGVTVAIQNGGGIRASIDAGAVTMGEVLTVLPFQNTVATFQLSGQGLMDSLEAGLSEIEEGKGKFPQVAGLRYTFDKSVAPNEGRLQSVEVREGDKWVPLDPSKTYTVATNNFVRQGGDGYKIFAENAENAYDYGPSLEQVLADYIAANSPLTPELDGRIQMVDASSGTENVQPGSSSQDAAAPGGATEPTVNSEQAPAESTASEPPATQEPADGEAAAQEPAPTQPIAGEQTDSSAQAEPPAEPQRIHVVVVGDTLWDLAIVAYGDGTRWREIVAANPTIRGDVLVIGQELILPAAN